MSKLFDYGTICASEQAVVVERAIADEVTAEFRKRKAAFPLRGRSGTAGADGLRREPRRDESGGRGTAGRQDRPDGRARPAGGR